MGDSKNYQSKNIHPWKLLQSTKIFKNTSPFRKVWSISKEPWNLNRLFWRNEIFNNLFRIHTKKSHYHQSCLRGWIHLTKAGLTPFLVVPKVLVFLPEVDKNLIFILSLAMKTVNNTVWCRRCLILKAPRNFIPNPTWSWTVHETFHNITHQDLLVMMDGQIPVLHRWDECIW